MVQFGAESLKPTMILTNNIGAQGLRKKGRQEKAQCKGRTTNRYVDRRGLRRFQGTPRLKASQMLGLLSSTTQKTYGDIFVVGRWWCSCFG